MKFSCDFLKFKFFFFSFNLRNTGLNHFSLFMEFSFLPMELINFLLLFIVCFFVFSKSFLKNRKCLFLLSCFFIIICMEAFLENVDMLIVIRSFILIRSFRDLFSSFLNNFCLFFCLSFRFLFDFFLVFYLWLCLLLLIKINFLSNFLCSCFRIWLLNWLRFFNFNLL